MQAVLPRAAARARRVDARVALGVVLMIAAILGGTSVLRGATARSEVVVAARSVQPGQVVTAKDLRTAKVALDGEVESLPASSLGSLVGRVAAEPLYAGKLLTRRSLSTGPPVPYGYVAMSLALKPERAVAGSLRPGDRVGIIATSNPGRPDAKSMLLFQQVPVVSVTSRVGAEGQLVVVTLQVRPEEARALAEARNAGELDLFIVSTEAS